jgi:voltage-gated potassium channel
VPFFVRVWQQVYVSIATLSWSILGILFACHALASYALFAAAGETKLTDSVITFVYFYMTTATTVGYGDLSPGGDAGRLVNVCIVLPGSIALFTVLLGKAVAGMSAFWRRRLQGLGDFSERAGHTLVVGWQGARSRRVIEGLLGDAPVGAPRIVLLARGLESNPMPDAIDFVAAEQLGDRTAFLRAGAASAHTIIIRGADDDETLAATLAGRSAASRAHMVAHFHEDSAADLIRHHAVQGTPIRAVMLPRLGPNVWHDTPAAAMATLEELEETARLMLLQPQTPPLRATDLDELRQTFGARW